SFACAAPARSRRACRRPRRAPRPWSTVLMSRPPARAAWRGTLVPCQARVPCGRCGLGLPHAEEKLGDQLVEPFVAIADGAERIDVDCLGIAAQRGDGGRARAAGQRLLAELLGLGCAERSLDLGVVAEPACLVGEDEVGAHATAREVPYPVR